MAAEYDIYTDGSCQGNPGPGGWAAIILSDGKRVDEASGWERETTNNRMEVQAAIGGLSRIPEGARATVHSDSQILVNCASGAWKRRANLDLWQKLDALASTRRVEWRWLQGHSGDRWNEEADALAQRMAEASSVSPQQKPGGAISTGARMIDISQKPDTPREATARGYVVMRPETLARIRDGAVEKGDVLSTARLAGIMAAKRTPDIVPLCHPILLSDVRVDLSIEEKDSSVGVSATVKTTGKTGAEMEALTAVAVAALTVYDMCKSIDPAMRLEGIRLVRKSGGKSGEVVLE